MVNIASNSGAVLSCGQDHRRDETAEQRQLCRLWQERWRVEIVSELRETVIGPDGLRLEELVRTGEARIVKDGKHRTVYHLVLPQGNFFLKRYRLADWRAALRTLFRGSKADREWRALQQVRDAGIPTVEPVGRATRFAGPRPTESWLILRALEDVHTIHELLKEDSPAYCPLTPKDRRRLNEAIARLVASLHNKGLLHHDLHAGNLLVRRESQGDWRLWLIDLHTVGHYRRLSVRQVQRELAMFSHFFSLRSTPTERLRFFHTYWRQIADEPESKVRLSSSLQKVSPAENSVVGQKFRPGKEVMRQFAEAAADWSQRAFRKADEKWHRGHRKLIVVRSRTVECRGVAELGDDLVGRFAVQPEVVLKQLAERKRVRIFLWGKTGIEETASKYGETVVRAFSASSCRWLGKRYCWSAARRAWEMGHALLRRGLDTPRPLLWWERTDTSSPCAVLVTEKEYGQQVISSRQQVSLTFRSPHEELPSHLAFEEKDVLSAVEQAGRLLRRLHDHGFLLRNPSPALFEVVHRFLPESEQTVGNSFSSDRRAGTRETYSPDAPLSAPDAARSLPASRVRIAEAAAIFPIRKVSWKQRRQQLATLYANSRQCDFVPGIAPPPPSIVLRFLRFYLGPQKNSRWKAEWRSIACLARKELHNTSSCNVDKTADKQPFRAETEPVAKEKETKTAEISTDRRRFLRSALFGGISLLAGLSWLGGLTGCRSTTNRQLASRPARHSIRAGKLVVMSDHPLDSRHPLITELVQLRKQVVVTLQLPPQRTDVVVYIFSTPESYQQYLDTIYPGLPRRRAYFVGTREELAVYTYWGDRIQEDLRHEYTHGLLHASLKSVPLWIDEGLAEYFEVVGPRVGTVNTDYARRLSVSLSRGWQPRLQRLEQIEEFSQMRHIDYQEAWAWVHFLLHHSPETRQILLSYLQDLRTEAHPRLISQRLQEDLPDFQQRFTTYVASLQTPQLLFPRTATTPRGSEPKVPRENSSAGHVQLTPLSRQ